MELKDKIVVVTGGAGLIGSRFIEAICRNGGYAVIADLNQNAMDELKIRLKSECDDFKLDSVKVDICDKSSIQAAIAYLKNEYGRIDAVVNNAYPRNKNYGNKLEDVEFNDFCENINLHLGGYFLMCQQFAAFFLNQGWGNIINISSIYGIVAPRFEIYDDTAMTMPIEYAAIKSALIHLTKYLARYYKGKNIRFNSLSLGGVLNNQPDSFVKSYQQYSLNKGMLDTDDVIGSLVFLLSDSSQYVNGHNLVVDDGWSL